MVILIALRGGGGGNGVLFLRRSPSSNLVQPKANKSHHYTTFVPPLFSHSTLRELSNWADDGTPDAVALASKANETVRDDLART